MHQYSLPSPHQPDHRLKSPKGVWNGSLEEFYGVSDYFSLQRKHLVQSSFTTMVHSPAEFPSLKISKNKIFGWYLQWFKYKHIYFQSQGFLMALAPRKSAAGWLRCFHLWVPSGHRRIIIKPRSWLGQRKRVWLSLEFQILCFTGGSVKWYGHVGRRAECIRFTYPSLTQQYHFWYFFTQEKGEQMSLWRHSTKMQLFSQYPSPHPNRE